MIFYLKTKSRRPEFRFLIKESERNFETCKIKFKAVM